MTFSIDQKGEFRDNVKAALTSVELIASRAGLDEFDEELMMEVINLATLVSKLTRTTLMGISAGTPTQSVPDPQTALIQEEYQD